MLFLVFFLTSNKSLRILSMSRDTAVRSIQTFVAEVAVAIATFSQVGCGVVSGRPAVAGGTPLKLDSIDDLLINWSAIDMAVWRGGVIRWNVLWVSLTRSRVVVSVSLTSTIVAPFLIDLG